MKAISKRSLAAVLCVLVALLSAQPVRSEAKAEGKAITAANAEQLVVTQRLGQGLVKEARWIAGGKYFVECAWTGIWLYDGTRMDAAPRQLNTPARCQTFDANADGTIFAWTPNDTNENEPEQEDLVFIHNTVDGTTRTLQLEDERPELCKTCYGEVAAVRLSPDGTILYVMNKNGSSQIAEFRDVATGRLLGAIKRGYSADAPAEIFSYDSHLRLVWKHEIVELYRDSEKKPFLKFPFFSDHILSPDGIYQVRSTGPIYIYDTRNGEIWSVLKNLNGSSKAVFSPDGKVLALGGRSSGLIEFWDLRTLRKQKIWDTHSGILGLSWRADGVLSVLNFDLKVQFWDVKTEKLLYSRNTQTLPMMGVGFSPDGKSLFSTANATFYVWDTETGKRRFVRRIAPLNELPYYFYFQSIKTYDQIAVSAVFSNDGKRLLTSSIEVGFWDAQSGQKLGELPISNWNFSYLANENSLFVPDMLDDSHLDWFDPLRVTLKVIDPQVQYKHRRLGVGGVAMSRDGQTIAIHGSEAEDMIAVWDVTTETVRAKLEPTTSPYYEEVVSMALTSDGRYLALSYKSDVVEVWDVVSQKPIGLFELPVPDPFYSDNYFPAPVAFSPDGSLLVVGASIRGEIYLLDAQTLRLIKTLEIHKHGVRDIQFNATGDKLATASLDGSITILEIPEEF